MKLSNYDRCYAYLTFGHFGETVLDCYHWSGSCSVLSLHRLACFQATQSEKWGCVGEEWLGDKAIHRLAVQSKLLQNYMDL